MTKSSAKVAAPQSRRRKPRKAVSKIAKKTNRKVALETASDTRRKPDLPTVQARGSTVQEAVRGVAEQNVAQTRELCERSKSTIEAMLDSWQKSFGAAGQGAIALNRTILDITDRNINNSLDLATALAGAKNLAEVVELQTTYWRKQLGDLAPLTNRARS